MRRAGTSVCAVAGNLALCQIDQCVLLFCRHLRPQGLMRRIVDQLLDAADHTGG